MAVVAMPANPVWRKRAWIPPSRNQVNESAWTGARQVLRLPGAALWRVSAAHVPLTREIQTWPWKAFLTVLEGQANTFLMPYACSQTGVANPRVQAAVQGEGRATLAGFPASRFILNGGRAMTFLHPSGRRQMVLLTNDLTSDAAGVAVARFRGVLREAPAVTSVVEIRNPVCEMAMVNGDVGWDEEEGVYSIAFDAREAFGPV
jgi:hypothetical protein